MTMHKIDGIQLIKTI